MFFSTEFSQRQRASWLRTFCSTAVFNPESVLKLNLKLELTLGCWNHPFPGGIKYYFQDLRHWNEWRFLFQHAQFRTLWKPGQLPFRHVDSYEIVFPCIHSFSTSCCLDVLFSLQGRYTDAKYVNLSGLRAILPPLLIINQGTGAINDGDNTSPQGTGN